MVEGEPLFARRRNSQKWRGNWKKKGGQEEEAIIEKKVVGKRWPAGEENVNRETGWLGGEKRGYQTLKCHWLIQKGNASTIACSAATSRQLQPNKRSPF